MNPEENVVVDAPVVEETVAEEVTVDAPVEDLPLSDKALEPATELTGEASDPLEDAVEEKPTPEEVLETEVVVDQEDLDAHPELADAGIEVGTVGKVVTFMGKPVVAAKVVAINGKNYVEVTLDDTTTYNSPIDSVSKELLELAQNS